MKFRVKKSTIGGRISAPSSKSHTIRAILIATFADGVSKIEDALLSGDGLSALKAAEAFGATYSLNEENTLIINGLGNNFNAGRQEVFMGNSGTSTRLFASMAALGSVERLFDGDSSLRSRPMKPLLNSLKNIGLSYRCIGEKDVPFSVKGPITGGEVTIAGTTSQYLSALLLSAPLCQGDIVVNVTQLNEKPYVTMTLKWLDKMGIHYEKRADYSWFKVFGKQSYKPISEKITGDFSSATFAAVAAAVTGSRVRIDNLDFSDAQGDKKIFDYLEEFGAIVERGNNFAVVDATSSKIKGCTIDLNETPDALPAFAVLGTIAEGETRIVNVPQARIKETDRIKVMYDELKKLGADIAETSDGLIIKKSNLTGCIVNGYEDHRVVMSLALAASVAKGTTEITTAEAVDVTYPFFADDFQKIGLNIKITD